MSGRRALGIHQPIKKRDVDGKALQLMQLVGKAMPDSWGAMQRKTRHKSPVVGPRGEQPGRACGASRRPTAASSNFDGTSRRSQSSERQELPAGHCAGDHCVSEFAQPPNSQLCK
eukprot:EG_transcript_24066